MRTLITTSGKDSFIKTVTFLCSIGYSFLSCRKATEEMVSELYEAIYKQPGTEENDVPTISIQGKYLTVNAKRFFHSIEEQITNEINSPIM